MRVHNRNATYSSDMTDSRKKFFDAQGIRPYEYVEPDTFSPFITHVEAKSIHEKFYSIHAE
jgi:hypothetical protein